MFLSKFMNLKLANSDFLCFSKNRFFMDFFCVNRQSFRRSYTQDYHLLKSRESLELRLDCFAMFMDSLRRIKDRGCQVRWRKSCHEFRFQLVTENACFNRQTFFQATLWANGDRFKKSATWVFSRTGPLSFYMAISPESEGLWDIFMDLWTHFFSCGQHKDRFLFELWFRFLI